MTKEIAVITADVVASRELAPGRREALYAEVKALLQGLKGEGWIASYELYRGDALQCVAARTPQALRVALLLRSYLKAYTGARGEREAATGKYDIRTGIGIGGVDFFSQTDLAHSDGPAFRLSGEGLDALKEAPWRLSVRTADAAFTESLEPAVLLLDAVIQKWTPGQAEAVHYRLKDLKEEEISRRAGVTQPAINQRLKGAQWWAVDALLRYFENWINP